MKNFIILFVLLLFFPLSSLAEDFRIYWSVPVPDVEGYELWEVTDTGPISVANVDSSQTEFLFFAEFLSTECRTWYVTAYVDSIHSQPSEAVHWCRPTTVPIRIIRPGTVNIILEIQ